MFLQITLDIYLLAETTLYIFTQIRLTHLPHPQNYQ